MDPNLIGAVIVAGVTLALAIVGGGITIFARQRSMETKIDANHEHAKAKFEGVEGRLELIERDMGKLDQVAADVSYVRGFLDGERGPARERHPFQSPRKDQP